MMIQNFGGCLLRGVGSGSGREGAAFLLGSMGSEHGAALVTSVVVVVSQ